MVYCQGLSTCRFVTAGHRPAAGPRSRPVKCLAESCWSDAARPTCPATYVKCSPYGYPDAQVLLSEVLHYIELTSSQLQNCTGELNYRFWGVICDVSANSNRVSVGYFRNESLNRTGRGHVSKRLSINHMEPHSSQSFPLAHGGVRAAH